MDGNEAIAAAGSLRFLTARVQAFQGQHSEKPASSPGRLHIQTASRLHHHQDNDRKLMAEMTVTCRGVGKTDDVAAFTIEVTMRAMFESPVSLEPAIRKHPEFSKTVDKMLFPLVAQQIHHMARAMNLAGVRIPLDPAGFDEDDKTSDIGAPVVGSTRRKAATDTTPRRRTR